MTQDAAGRPMHGFKGERVLMRIHVGESDKHNGKCLYRAIVELLRSKHYAGATVLRGMMGFGANARVRGDHIELLSLDLPVIIECIETEERIAAILPEIDAMIEGGLITLERAKVIMYRADIPPERRTASWQMDMTGSWEPEEGAGS